MRRVEFPGKRRVRRRIRVPESGTAVVTFPQGMQLHLDLSEALQRDFYAGLHDLHELKLVRRLLAGKGDFVDVGAHVGLYAVLAGQLLAGRGRVLAVEPHPRAVEQLEENIRLNGLDNVIVAASAASAGEGTARLAVPRTNDPSFSTLESAPFDEAEPLTVRTTTVDAEVARHGLEPALVKIDVQDHEVAVLEGMPETLALFRPAILVEVGTATVEPIAAALPGYLPHRVHRRRLSPGLGERTGWYNVLFVPEPR
jgi:FkbM family methyltransferase